MIICFKGERKSHRREESGFNNDLIKSGGRERKSRMSLFIFLKDEGGMRMTGRGKTW